MIGVSGNHELGTPWRRPARGPEPRPTVVTADRGRPLLASRHGTRVVRHPITSVTEGATAAMRSV